ncbi:hypothetical protein FB451DRAFT_1170292 [Mycena latifolia]|nr:hypothetical protein FB451DRAFT_1170292 [Mycena latifolia]
MELTTQEDDSKCETRRAHVAAVIRAERRQLVRQRKRKCETIQCNGHSCRAQYEKSGLVTRRFGGWWKKGEELRATRLIGVQAELDRYMSRWGGPPRRSFVASPEENCDSLRSFDPRNGIECNGDGTQTHTSSPASRSSPGTSTKIPHNSDSHTLQSSSLMSLQTGGLIDDYGNGSALRARALCLHLSVRRPAEARAREFSRCRWDTRVERNVFRRGRAATLESLYAVRIRLSVKALAALVHPQLLSAHVGALRGSARVSGCTSRYLARSYAISARGCTFRCCMYAPRTASALPPPASPRAPVPRGPACCAPEAQHTPRYTGGCASALRACASQLYLPFLYASGSRASMVRLPAPRTPLCGGALCLALGPSPPALIRAPASRGRTAAHNFAQEKRADAGLSGRVSRTRGVPRGTEAAAPLRRYRALNEGAGARSGASERQKRREAHHSRSG